MLHDSVRTSSCSLLRAGGALRQVNARKIYDEPDVLGGVLGNRLFLGILGGELLLQARRPGLALGRGRPWAQVLKGIPGALTAAGCALPGRARDKRSGSPLACLPG